MEQPDDVNRWELEPSEIQVGRKLGQGTFGVVYKGALRGKEVAVKKLYMHLFDEEAISAFRAEVSTFRYASALIRTCALDELIEWRRYQQQIEAPQCRSLHGRRCAGWQHHSGV
jgi:hypothetical protein